MIHFSISGFKSRFIVFLPCNWYKFLLGPAVNFSPSLIFGLALSHLFAATRWRSPADLGDMANLCGDMGDMGDLGDLGDFGDLRGDLGCCGDLGCFSGDLRGDLAGDLRDLAGDFRGDLVDARRN